MSRKEPYVSVLMSAYNAERYIEEAIKSIINQTFADFEFLIIDDGSDDSTADIIKSYMVKDKRICLLRNRENKGISYSANKGIEIANGKYIARMDADDISLSHRLETQIKFMDSHCEVAVSSAWMETFGNEKKNIWKSPTTHDEIVATLFCSNCIWNPVSIIRKEVLDTHNLRYNINYQRGEDYRLWTQISKYQKVANIPKVLHRYRIHEDQTMKLPGNSWKGKIDLQTVKDLPGVRVELLRNFLSREVTIDEVELHQKLFFEIPFVDEKELDDIQEWVDFLISVNQEKKKFVEPTFSNALQNSLLHAKRKSFKLYCNQNKRFTPKLLIKLFFSKSKYYLNFSLFQLSLITLSCLFFRSNKNYSVEYLNIES